MARLFDVDVPAISKRLKNIFSEGELDELSTISKMETVQVEGARQVIRHVDYYNLDAIISVGYRVNSQKTRGRFLPRLLKKRRNLNTTFSTKHKKSIQILKKN